MNKRIVRLIAEIDEFKGMWNSSQMLPETSLNSLQRFATIESIGSSTRIEGVKLSDKEVEELLSELETKSFRSRDEQEVAGYAKAISLIYDSWENMELTESMIKSIHHQLLQYSQKDEWHLGEYKKHPNHVAAFDIDGRQIGIVFETVSPFETPMTMGSLIAQTRQNFEDADFHPLLVISEFIIRFLAIHPFQDGNGRLARLLTNLLLLKSGYSYMPYSSLERLVEANKEDYYKSLRSSQMNLKDENPDLNIWIIFFLEMLKKQKDLLLKAIEQEKKLDSIPELSRSILEIVRTSGRASVADILRITGANRNTIKVHLKELVIKKQLELKGKGRGAYYIIT